jgi:Xaa-Pro dipeptidase
MNGAPALDELTRLYEQHVGELEKSYAKVLSAQGWDGVAIHSGLAKLRSAYDDVYWPLRVTPHFQHWLPLAVADCVLLVVPGKRPVLYRNVEPNFWEAPAPPETGHFWPSFELVDVTDPAKLKDLLPKGGKIAFLGEEKERGAALGFGDRMAPPELVKALDALRTLKSPYEILCLHEANRRAALGHDAVANAFRAADRSELDLHLLYLGATRQDDPETPYKNIVALGEHAATLHHIGYDRGRSAAQALLLDAGATYQGYASDVTRTYVKGKGHGAEVFGGLISKMETLQQEMCRRAKPGIPYQQLHNQSHELLAAVLRDLGIARASDGELVESGVTRTFLPHGLGHSLGLQTHDVGCALVKPEPRNPFLRNTTTVTPAQVFTIEPGCYFIPALLDDLKAKPAGKSVDWKLVEELKAFGGVRIEDDLVVQDGGSRNLTREALP